MAARTRFSIGKRRRVADYHWEYDIAIGGVKIVTTVTRNQNAVADWITKACSYRHNGDKLIVGCDMRDGLIGTIHLFVGRICLVYQILLAGRSAIPVKLANFLRDKNNIFAGEKITTKISSLQRDFGIGEGAVSLDLGEVAADMLDKPELTECGIKKIAGLVLDRDFSGKPPPADNEFDGVQFAATLRAFLSFKTGCKLYARLT